MSYPGFTRLDRLHHIGSHSTYFAIDAYRAAIAEAKQGKNVKLYATLVEEFYQIAPDDPAALLDTAWAEEQTRKVRMEHEKLEHELKSYKNNLIKESIRVGPESMLQPKRAMLTCRRWATRTWATSISPVENGTPHSRPTCACGNTAPPTSILQT